MIFLVSNLRCIILVLFLYTHTVNSTWMNVTAGKQVDLGPFDTLALVGDSVIVVSGHPCSTGNTVTLSIIRIQEGFFIQYSDIGIEKYIKDPILIDKNGTGIVFEYHPHEHISNGHRHLIVKQVYVDANNTITYQPDVVIEKRWNFEHKKCQKHIGIMTDTSNPGFLQQKDCTQSMRSGDFSTICYVKNSALYMSVLNICDVPYSVNVVSMVDIGEVSVHKFTAEKDDNALHITHGNLGGHCGLILETFHSHLMNHEKQHVVIKHVCFNSHSGKNFTVIDDSYYTVYGMLCGLSNCNRTNPEKHTCFGQIYNVNGTKVKSTIEIGLDICQEGGIYGSVKMAVEGFPKTFSAQMTSDDNTINNNNNVGFNLGTGYSTKNLHLHKGYFPIDGGEVSLYVKEEVKRRTFHVMLLRHFPRSNDRFPLVHDDFVLDREKICIGRKQGPTSTPKRKAGIETWSIILIVACIILIIIGVGLLVRWWKNRRLYHDGKGLPYHIELDDDEFSIDAEKFANDY